MDMKNRRHVAAFTLVELSIVLVILGLLVGGVLAGQSLIKAAELRTVTSEFTGYKTALGAFREKYNALPGDMRNAVRFWGADAAASSDADGIDAACAATTTAAVGTATCNGDGNGKLSDINSVPANHEFFRFWQHLANAGLIEGNYTGVAGPDSDQDTIIGTNIPRSKYPSAGWAAWYYDGVSSPVNYPGTYNNLLHIGAELSSFPDQNYGLPFNVSEMYNIDMKMDDGKPHQGFVRSHNYAARPDCVTSSDDAYQLDNQTLGCSIIFITGY